jgi:hypothetical protein
VKVVSLLHASSAKILPGMSPRNVTRSSQEEMHVDITAIGADEVCTLGVASNPSEHRCTDVERSADPARNSLSSQELSNPSRQTNQNHSSNSEVHCAQGDLGASQTRRNNTAKRRKNGNWEDSEMRAAIAAVDDGMTIRKAATTYGIPRSSLEDWLYGRTRSRRRGKEGTLTAEEERLIVNWICKRQDMGWPLTNLDLRLKVCEITQTRPTPFKSGIPGASWLRWWKRRHPELTLRVPQGLDTARARALIKENVDSFYTNLQTLYNLHQYST